MTDRLTDSTLVTLSVCVLVSIRFSGYSTTTSVFNYYYFIKVVVYFTISVIYRCFTTIILF